MHRLIEHNAKLINELHRRIHDEFRKQPHGESHKRASEEFHAKYDGLAFPGGYEAGLQKIEKGDTTAIEGALAFLEVQPYFFRSQYMRTKILRLLGHAQMTESQRSRFQSIKQKKAEQASPANRHPFGTSGMPPANSASRAGSMPEASGDS